MKYAVAHPDGDQTEQGMYPVAYRVNVLKAGSILFSLQKGIGYIHHKTQCQYSKKPIFPGIIIIFKILVILHIIRKEERTKQIENQDIANNKKIGAKGPNMQIVKLIFPPPKVEQQQENIGRPQ
jgi:hypothetical protein